MDGPGEGAGDRPGDGKGPGDGDNPTERFGDAADRWPLMEASISAGGEGEAV